MNLSQSIYSVFSRFEECGVVYKLICKKRKMTYVGQTGRLLNTRVEEHKKNLGRKFNYHKVLSFFWRGGKMTKYFIDVIQDSLRTGLAYLLKPKPSLANLGRNKKISPPVDADSQVHPGRRTAGASPDAISTGPRCCRALHAHRAPSSSSPGWRMTR